MPDGYIPTLPASSIHRYLPDENNWPREGITTLDLETTVVRYPEVNVVDNSPYNPRNRIVSAHFKRMKDEEATSLVFYHTEKTNNNDLKELHYQLQEVLNNTKLLVGHNLKFDLQWLLSCGFEYTGQCYDTMIGEYILARGQKLPLSLKESAIRRKCTSLKKSDLIDDMFKKQKLDFSEMPLDIVIEYGNGDVITTEELFLIQVAEYEKERNKGLIPVRNMSNQMLEFLTEIELNGCSIDMDTLLQVESDYVEEKRKLLDTLDEISRSVLGDRPSNLNSGADLSAIIYSREVVDREEHVRVFNIGTDDKGKPLRRPRMSQAQYVKGIKRTTRPIQKQIAYHCHDCGGTGKVRKIKKDGTAYKKDNICPSCKGAGVLLKDTGSKAGLGLIPDSIEDVCVHGFKSDKGTIKRLVAQAEDRGLEEAQVFLKSIMRLNAINTYLSTFVNGIKFWTRGDGILHPGFNQCVTSTGRLSSTSPNLQNLVKGTKFPVRKAIVSRFGLDKGVIFEADYSGLEFRTAGELSKDEQILADIMNGKDTHKQTASIILQKPMEEVTKDERQNAKSHTFAPLYGATGAGEQEHVKRYYTEFFNIYKGMDRYNKKNFEKALSNGIVEIPSGRQYYYPNVRRMGNGRVTNSTVIMNYPVQGFATADIVPLACIRAYEIFKAKSFKSKLILTVHDSIVVDCLKTELEAVTEALKEAMLGVVESLEYLFNYKTTVPLAIEYEHGPNWMETA